MYKKNEGGWYEPRYIKETTGRYFYVHRPLKFIENSFKRNKVLFDFKLEGDIMHKEELLLTETSLITKEDLLAVKEQEKIPYEEQRKYDASVWGNQETIAPTTELKNFDANAN